MDRWSDSLGKGMGAEESNEGIARGESGPCFHWHLTPGLSQAEASTRRSDQLPGPIGFTLGFFHPPETVAVRAAGHTCARISSVCSRAIRRQKFRCKPFKTGSSLFPMGEQTKPILSFGGIDRSWASSRDESLRERLRLIVSARGFLGPAHRRQVIAVCDQQTPPLTPETISRRAAPTFRHLAKLISGFLL